MREVGVVYRADKILLGWLHLYWLHTEVSDKTTTSTHVTLIALSHHYSITLGCNAVQWHSTKGPGAHQGYGGQRPYKHLERPMGPPQLTHEALLTWILRLQESAVPIFT